MYAPAASVLERLEEVSGARVIAWGCPVPFFGQLLTARVATVGINPSNREFLDENGLELSESHRRLPTLRSLGLKAWRDADAAHVRKILDACSTYFLRNPYDRWFRVLEQVLRETNSSFYGRQPSACHLDLIPYATSLKWGQLPMLQRRALIHGSRDSLGLFLRESPIELLVLNGTAVVETFQELTGAMLTGVLMADWDLLRNGRPAVAGVAYHGQVDSVGGVELDRPISVLGYNHNLQSSFGITSEVLDGIRRWVGSMWKEAA